MKGKKTTTREPAPVGGKLQGFIKILMLTNLLSGVAAHVVASNLRMDYDLGNLSFPSVEQTI